MPSHPTANRTAIHLFGLTATGKTALALSLATTLSNRFSTISLISLDSRQVYRDIPLTSGADIDPSWNRHEHDAQSYYEVASNVQFYGLSFLYPRERCSVGIMRQIVQLVAQKTWKKNGVVILVGGTGLYHRLVFDPTFEIKSEVSEDQKAEIEHLPLSQLQQKISALDSLAISERNVSDQQNPRRLQRMLYQLIQKSSMTRPQSEGDFLQPIQQIKIGLTIPQTLIASRIERRVHARLAGAIEEVTKLRAASPEDFSSLPLFTATGVHELNEYLDGYINRETCVKNWITREMQYAKRQRTWFQKYEASATWFDVSQVSPTLQLYRIVNAL